MKTSDNTDFKQLKSIDDIKESLINSLKENTSAIDYTTRAIEYLPRKYICELLDTINQLTVIKQQTSSEIETVSKGNHICLITKSHGFQWIKFDDEIL